MAADERKGLAFLREEAERSNDPTILAAYVDQLYVLGPPYRRAGNVGAGPGFEWAEDNVRKLNAQDHRQEYLTPEQAAPMLEALARWERVEPENGYPYMMKMWYRYGLHQDEAALNTWEEAAKRPYATLRTTPINNGAAKLVYGLGGHGRNLPMAAQDVARTHGYLLVPEVGRIASYETAAGAVAGPAAMRRCGGGK